MFIIKELREDNELLPQELVGEVDGGVDDAGAVGADAVGHVADGDGVEVLAVAGLLHKHLAVHVVVVAGGEHLDVPHHLEHCVVRTA